MKIFVFQIMGNFFSNLFANLFGQKELRILILGLDGAGVYFYQSKSTFDFHLAFLFKIIFR